MQGGKSSFPENYREPREWKHSILKRYYDPAVDTIIDVGCGDLQLWKGISPAQGKFTGVDISQMVIDTHKQKYPYCNFICASSDKTLNISADVVTCFDMLYHILDDEVFIATLKNLKRYAKRHLLIYTWGKNPWGWGIWPKVVQFYKTGTFTFDRFTTDGSYQMYREFLMEATPIFEPEFELIEIRDYKRSKYGTMYVYARRGE